MNTRMEEKKSIKKSLTANSNICESNLLCKFFPSQQTFKDLTFIYRFNM